VFAGGSFHACLPPAEPHRNVRSEPREAG
jgi:hypothetical protein